MSSPTLPSTSIANINMTCATTMPVAPPDSPGLIILGPTPDERDILYNCCQTLATTSFTANHTACLSTAVCDVQSCSFRDPTYVCVARLRENWGVEWTFGCEEGAKEGGAREDGVKDDGAKDDGAKEGGATEEGAKASGGLRKAELKMSGWVSWAAVAVVGVVQVLSWIDGI